VVPARLHEAMRYAAMDGGKRVRPLLVYAAGDMFDTPPRCWTGRRRPWR
jgi:farnesyl diphosphate synthase